MNMIIFLKETNRNEYKVRLHGRDTWLDKDEFIHQVKHGNVFFKANKPVYENDLARFK